MSYPIFAHRRDSDLVHPGKPVGGGLTGHIETTDEAADLDGVFGYSTRPASNLPAMHTIFGIASTSAKMETLVKSLEANSVPLHDITLIMPGDAHGEVPLQAEDARAVADDFSGNPKQAIAGGAIGVLLGLGVMAVSVLPALVAVGAGVAALSAVVSGGAGGILGALTGLGISGSKIAHYSAKLEKGEYLIVVKAAGTERSQEIAGLFERQGAEDIAVADVAEFAAAS
jgi:hypothetical protein